MKKREILYSYDNELFCCDDAHEAIAIVADYLKEPGVITIWSGRPVKSTIVDVLPGIKSIIDSIQELHYEAFLDYDDNYLEFITEAELEELELAYKKVFLDWAHKYKKHPIHNTITDVKELRYRVTKLDPLEWECIE